MPLPAAIDISKALLIGCGSALAYYVFISYIFRLVVYPSYRKAADFLVYESIKPEIRTKTERYRNLLRFGRLCLSILMGLTWWLIFGGYLYLVYLFLTYYFTTTHGSFWVLAGIAVALPTLWVIWRFIGFFRKKEIPTPTWEWDDRPLLEQMQGD